MASCILCGGKEVQGEGCDVLIVGLEGSGKSLLCRRLQGLHPKEGMGGAFSAYTVTTNGIQLTEVCCPRGAPFKTVMIREVGGQMSPLWPQYYDDCRMVVFLVDASDASVLAMAAIELCELMQHPKLKGKPTCVVLSKQDQSLVLSRQEVEIVMQLHDLERISPPGAFTVMEMSSIPGSFAAAKGRGGDGQGADAVESLLEWIVEHKCLALGLQPPGRKEGLHPAEGGLFTPKWAGGQH